MQGEVWGWTLALMAVYGFSMAAIYAASWFLIPYGLVDWPIWRMMTVFIGGAVLLGLLMSLPAMMVMRRVNLWILPRNAMGLPGGRPQIRTRLRDVRRFGWAMQTGNGRFVIDHLERVRTGTPFGQVKSGLPHMDDETLRAMVKTVRGGTWGKTLLGLLAGLGIGGGYILLSEAGLPPWASFSPVAALIIFMPLVIVFGTWPHVKRWGQAYTAWLVERGVNISDNE